MPRDLADVLHYFLPELDEASVTEEPRPESRVASANAHSDSSDRRIRTESIPASIPPPILGVPIGDRDLVRAALTWNLAVETARTGKRVMVLAPTTDVPTPLWPEAGVGPLGTELAFCPAQDLDELAAAATQRSIESANSKGRAVDAIFLRVPTHWLEIGSMSHNPIPWWLLMSSPNPRDLSDSYDLVAAIQAAISTPGTTPTIGLTVHGVSEISEAQQAYEHLSRRCGAQLGLDLVSYGLLVDDLHVYRAIAAQRPIGLAHPQAPATKALMDVARLLSEDAENLARG